MTRFWRLSGPWAVLLLSIAALTNAQTAPTVTEGIEALRKAAGGELTVSRSSKTQLATFVKAGRGKGIAVPDASANTPAKRADSFIRAYGNVFGLRGREDVSLMRVEKDRIGMDHVRLQQTRAGIPVTGGELILHLRGNKVMAANGKTVANLDSVNLNPTVTALAALGRARALIRKNLKVENAEFTEPRLEIFSRGILDNHDFPARLAWFVEAKAFALREFIWIDARGGMVLLHFSQLTDAKNRSVYTSNHTSALPGTLVRSEGGASNGDTDADLAYDYAGITYDYYLTEHGRDSFDGAGAQIRSSVHYCEVDCPAYDNAFWSGTQMVYGDGFAQADDVVAHELTHAVTERTSNLFYYMQSGALNESFSDIFGETIDQLDGVGTDGPAYKWKLGEDLPVIGAIRDMMTPTLFHDPGKMTDSDFRCVSDPLEQDAGGVHTNSGVPNHAYALMVDGGTYNSFTITGIGLTKAAKIQYRALTQYLFSAADFLDNYNALQSACSDLIGTAGITVGDCTEVKKALDAVQMSNPWKCLPTQPTVPALCSAGSVANTSFLDNFESGIGNWTPSDTGTWFRTSNPANPLGGAAYATSGVDSLWGNDRDTGTPFLSSMALNSNRTIPAGSRLYFNHSYGFEDEADQLYDAGIVEYSVNGGSSWQSLQPLYLAGADYGGPVFSFNPPDPLSENPLHGQQAFVGDSFGYTASQYDLSTLAGQTQVRFRFRIGVDYSYGDYGWFIDDFRIYKCDPPLAPLVTTLAPNPVNATTAQLKADIDTQGFTATVTFEYGLTMAYGMTASVPGTFNGLASPSVLVSSLTCNTPYHARAVATSEGGVTQGNDVLFTTGACGLPIVTTGTATLVTAGSATLNGTVNPNSSATTAAFEYGLTNAYGSMVAATPAPGAGAVPVAVSAAVSGLTCATDYHYRLTATNGSGPSLGSDATFTTTACLISISDAAQPEGNIGTTNMVFNVTLAVPASQTVTVSAVTSNLSATSGSDYIATGPTTVTFLPGEVTQPFSVAIQGDTVLESDETFKVTLSSPVNAAIADGEGIGTILNDDGASRTFISASGVDGADCSVQVSPCRNIASALASTATDGEIIILTPGEYESAPLTIDKGVKVTSPSGTVAFIRQPITVNAPGRNVVLRGLTLKGAGAGEAVTLTAASGLSLEDVTLDRWATGLLISNASITRVNVVNSAFRSSGAGIKDTAAGAVNLVVLQDARFEGNANGVELVAATATVRDSFFTNNSSHGLIVGPGLAEIQTSTFSANGTAVATLTGATLRIGGSHIFGNGVGFNAAAGSLFESRLTNVLGGNTTATIGTIAPGADQ